ncbi:glycoside hydrolase family 73 protein [Granulicatella sp. 19428wC4_WM01]|uniref:glycoside hydrolase family 73 protein n=2 Tax=unclassified Granulicatella TaxID=2630493 RepID=UPI0010733F2A|nr:glycoside hydrolase family 73 protein [Granulicatella sp. WM01]MBF0780962.1 glycoside hydrolase family 73 protein [Granulicatella sp. 19428wC4_WM01]TFU92968.1 N-acetylmuramidase [Granulicatella sp. WM01]
MRKRQKRSYGILMLGITVSVFMFTLFFLMVPQPKKNEDSFQQAERQRQQEIEKQRYQFFMTIKPVVQEVSQLYGTFVSVTMAQAALESDFGNSQLSSQYYNLFGVKGTKETGVALLTKEFQNGAWVEVHEYFKVYDSWRSSIEEHAQLMRYGTSWNANQYESVLMAKTYQEAAKGLVSSGYATDPMYAQKLIEMIERYRLYEYDL